MVSLVVCGAINWDVSCFVDRLPVPGEEVVAEYISRVSGGTGGNVAVAAARVLGSTQVALIGALGRDDIARQQVAALEDEGVVTTGISQIAAEESGQAYILVDRTGENVIASHLGANARLGLKHLKKVEVRRQLRECEGIVLTDPPLDVAEALINVAKRYDIPLLWDPGILIGPNREALLSLAREAEVIFLNETEASALLETEKSDVSPLRLQKLGFHNHIVLKLGAQGAVMLEPANGTLIEIPALPLKELALNVVSTVGCGDVFAGVFASYCVSGSSLEQSLIMASAAGGMNASRPETRGSPDRTHLEEVANRSKQFGFVVRKRKLF
ncbi:MAG: PfkB family carbohydrate kinase [Dehalococcoidia bacterium]|nr:PfkB family carbohydrate kinase [Dehalococcoidia bacterium]MDH4299085.1 PfkB family carbohydrate kinase [Dehalococcoidia bacterium]MDH4367715.1 PfkB family carbohydrate kinase [Dehalococcoidia bacterium]